MRPTVRPANGPEGGPRSRPSTSTAAVQLIGLLLLIGGGVLIYLLVAIWPAGMAGAETAQGAPPRSTATVTVFVVVRLTLDPDSALLLLAIIAGALGSFVQVATSFSTFVGNQRFELSSGWRSEIVNSTLTTCRSQHPLALGSRVHQAARMTAAMVSLMVEQLTSLREWFLPDRPGPLVGLHIIQTGNGVAWADRWPKPRAVVVDAAGNQSLCGDPEALAPAAVRGPVGGFVEAPERFAPLLHAAFPDLREWQRVVFVLDGEPRRPELRGRGQGMVRRLRTADAAAVGALSDQSLWISKTWGGAAGLAGSGTAWGAFAGGRLVAVACPFFVGDRYEDIGVATEAGFRGQGWSTACAAGVCGDIRRRGRTPSWTTAPENGASIRVAEKLGFRLERHDRMFVIGIPIPRPAADPTRRSHR